MTSGKETDVDVTIVVTVFYRRSSQKKILIGAEGNVLRFVLENSKREIRRLFHVKNDKRLELFLLIKMRHLTAAT